MTPIDGALYNVILNVREAQRRCREASREDLVVQLETLKAQLLEMKKRCQDI